MRVLKRDCNAKPSSSYSPYLTGSSARNTSLRPENGGKGGTDGKGGRCADVPLLPPLPPLPPFARGRYLVGTSARNTSVRGEPLMSEVNMTYRPSALSRTKL